MKYKDYYATLGVARDADDATIKKAYRKLARRYHPDVSKEADTEEKFKDVAEAWRALKDPEARAAYDRLGTRRDGQEFEPAADWSEGFSAGGSAFDNIDLADLLASLHGRGRRPSRRAGPLAIPGEDFDVPVVLSLEDAFAGQMLELELMLPQHDATGRMRRVATRVRARIPAGAAGGDRLRIPGKGGEGQGGGKAGDLYLTITLAPHPRFHVTGHDVFLDLPLAPWEAVLGTSIQVPTLGGEVRLRIPPDTQNGQLLRLPGRGLPRPRKTPGDQFAQIGVVVPMSASEAERVLYRELSTQSSFNPRAGWAGQSAKPDPVHSGSTDAVS